MKKDNGSKDQSGVESPAPSPEFMAFEDAMKHIIKVPKKEVERREEEERNASVTKGGRAGRSAAKKGE